MSYAREPEFVNQAELEQELIQQACNYAIRYKASVPDAPVYPNADALGALAGLTGPLPENGMPAKPVLSLLNEVGSPAAVATSGGRYFGYVSGGCLPVGLAARILSDAWHQASALYAMSPLAAELERTTERWLVDLLGLPDDTIAGFVTGTSLATFCALAAARDHLLLELGWDVAEAGTFGAPPLRAVVNDKAHSCVWRALRLLGFGAAQIERVPTDNEGRIRVNKMPPLDNTCVLVLQAGDVNTGAFDDFANLCPLANTAAAWVHVDGAFGLWAAASDTYRHRLNAVELADSWAADAHKTLNAPYECGVVFCRRESAYRRAMATSAAYAPMSEQRDGMALVPEMSRRARAVEIWAIIKSLGRQGVAQLVEQLGARARLMASLLEGTAFSVLNEVAFNQVLIACDTDAQTEQVLSTVQNSGDCWCGGSQWNGRAVIRFSVCSWATTEDDIRLAAHTFIEALR